MNAVAVQGAARVPPVPPRKRQAMGMLAPDVGGLAMEVAARLQPLGEIIKKYGLSKSEFQELMKQPVFRDAVVEARSAFKSTANTPERIRIKAQLLTEAGLEEMYLILQNPNQPAAARVSAFGAIKTLTGLEKPDAPMHRQKFSLTINVASGTGMQATTIEAEAVEGPGGEGSEYEPGEYQEGVYGQAARDGLEGEADPDDGGEAGADGAEPRQGELRTGVPIRIIGQQHPKLAKTYSWPGAQASADGPEAGGQDTASGLSLEGLSIEPSSAVTSGTGL
jgi:hypothetical protein